MARLHVVVEGRSEADFFRLVLTDHLAGHGVYVDARQVLTGKKSGMACKGGVSTYPKIRNDLLSWMKQDDNQDSYFSTMFDVYGLPTDFPGSSASKSIADPCERVRYLESAFAGDIGHPRFIPHVQLHEFEALLFSDVSKITTFFPAATATVRHLQSIRSGFRSPEHIDDGDQTAPSKRLSAVLPGYAKAKATAGPFIAKEIGLPRMLEECGHFRAWVEVLSQLG